MKATYIITLASIFLLSCNKEAKQGTCFLNPNGGQPFVGKIIDSAKTSCTFQYQNEVKYKTGEIFHKKGELFNSPFNCSEMIKLKTLDIKIIDCPME